MMDHKVVSEEILARAGKDEVKAAEDELAPIQRTFARVGDNPDVSYTPDWAFGLSAV